ncbi:MAG TPA: nicotinate (nicotinamide) nucleotide adenylyltransferase [Thermoleophilaceae bacterium]|nr:nicotinate (nicotinamide) nucleotide adenylyltransferase [Thermoleophilaceae bacterium]
MRIGVFGGVFNPPHLGHLVCAQEACAGLGLGLVVWVPAGTPPHREIEDDPGIEERLTMCEYAVSADERFRLSRVEADLGGRPGYMADTLPALAERAPGDDLVLILGGDQARRLPGWHDPERVLTAVAAIGVAEREGGEREDVLDAVRELPGARDKIEFFDMPRIGISSTLVRARARERRPIRYLVPDKVAAYIGAQSLYRAAVPAGAGRGTA